MSGGVGESVSMLSSIMWFFFSKRKFSLWFISYTLNLSFLGYYLLNGVFYNRDIWQ